MGDRTQSFSDFCCLKTGGGPHPQRHPTTHKTYPGKVLFHRKVLNRPVSGEEASENSFRDPSVPKSSPALTRRGRVLLSFDPLLKKSRDGRGPHRGSPRTSPLDLLPPNPKFRRRRDSHLDFGNGASVQYRESN